MKNILLLFVVVLSYTQAYTQHSQLSILEHNWKHYILNESVNEDMVPYFFNLSPVGTWSDLDYTNRQRGQWPLRSHLLRTVEMAKAYNQKDNQFYRNTDLKKAILQAYNYWVNEDIINPNWWYPQIGVPQNIGLIMLLMENEIDTEPWQKGIAIMDRVEFGELTGQNLVWVSSNIVLRCILKNDTTLLEPATAKIRNEMKMVNNAEGLQPDYSFHQHGRQLQFGNYGLHFLEDQVKWMFILKGSQYDYTPEQIELMRNYFAQGQRWVIWKGMYDINSSGRQLFPDEQIKKYNRVKKAAIEMGKIDPEYLSLYQSISTENALAGVKYFPYSELTINRTSSYFSSIRMCSSRIKGSESGNGENLNGYYLADGAMYVMKTGEEYLNIFPYWDWRKIPGTTAIQDTVKLLELGWESYNMASDFVGGLTFEANAITSMQYNRDGVTANKSYFIFPEFTVCLGSGINGAPNQHLETTIEQNFSTSLIAKNSTLLQTNNTTHTKSLWHNNSGYIINQGQNIVACVKQKEANWTPVVSWISKEESAKPVFTLGIDHGKHVKNDSYAYAVFPAVKEEDFTTIQQHPPYTILSNTTAKQVVQFGPYTSVVFHKPGSINLSDSLRVSSTVPAILLCKLDENGLDISMCDPTQKLDMGQIEVSRTTNTKTKTSTHKVVFPTGTEKGTAVVLSKI
ncbi:polysaccharide lyase family 8 super-sandwich domain-containing protein [Formosa haliotis]|uniref:polysaccharide lyase family 8 super-sandwich domain-containing protein n=1 Tax=Formosa haliotis TaxID=1555194 RepID=UPI000825C0E8|nr:polysaccharide lyase family 8 super-sandwich domain-containing protein [Formosa haliotis]